jgi:UDP-N-acetyl-D-glucosamine dehydrogenase
MTVALALEALEEEHCGEIRMLRVGRGEVSRAQRPVVAVVGLGSEGLASAIALHATGARIIGIETSHRRLERIRAGEVDLPGSGREDLWRLLADPDCVLSGRLQMLVAADLVLICACGAGAPHGRPVGDPLQRTCASVVRHARPGQTLVLSDSASARARELLVRPLAARGLEVGVDVLVAFVPAATPSGTRLAQPRGRIRPRRLRQQHGR